MAGSEVLSAAGMRPEPTFACSPACEICQQHREAEAWYIAGKAARG